jgi:hypothetical protein
LAETSGEDGGGQSTTDDDTVYRVHVCLDGGPRSGMPLDTGFEENRSFDDEDEAQRKAEDIRANPMEYHPGALRDYPGSLKVEVNEDTPLASNEAL